MGNEENENHYISYFELRRTCRPISHGMDRFRLFFELAKYLGFCTASIYFLMIEFHCKLKEVV